MAESTKHVKEASSQSLWMRNMAITPFSSFSSFFLRPQALLEKQVKLKKEGHSTCIEKSKGRMNYVYGKEQASEV